MVKERRNNAALLLPCLLTGGTEVATLDTATALQALGYRVSVIVYFDETDPAMLAAFRQAGITVTLLGLPRAGGAMAAVRLGLALGKVLLKLRPSLVWLQYMTPTLVPLLVARLFTRRLLAAVHVAAGHYNVGGMARLRWLASWWCNAVIGVSYTSVRGIVGDAPTHSRLARRVKVLPNAIDTALASDAVATDWRRKLGIAAESPVIGYVGRLAHNKGADVLLQAVVRVNRQHPECHWLIVGEGAEKPKLQAIAEKGGLANKVHLVGSLPRDAVYGAMKGFDIAVVPSREEGFGLTALEAMACGVPLVASGVDALQEVVIDGETGLLFTPEDAKALADSLMRLLASPEQRQAMAAAAARHAETTYGRQAFVVKLGRLLNEKAVISQSGKVGRFMKRIIWSIIRKLRLGGLMLVIHPKSFLRQKGWFNSFAKKRSLDAEGGVIPWWSYGVIDFIDYRLNAGMSVLEFGSGSSSIWLGQRVRQVITIESDIKWIEILRSDLPDNVHIVHLEKPESLVVSDLPGDSGDFDVLIIDPFAHRINCAKAGLKFLSDEGVVVWDNTDGPDWSEIQRLMSDNGFKEISMSGLAPQEVSVTRTTIFYRPNNVFNI